MSVVICAYTEARWAQTLDAIGSVRRQPAPAEVILVVDHNDGLLATALREVPADVKVYPNEDSKGLSGARNTGVRRAGGAIVAFLDDDAVASDGWLPALVVPYADPNVLGVGGLVSPRWPDSGRPNWFPAEFDWVVGCSYTGQPTAPAAVRNFIGANMSFRATVFAAVGLFATHVGRSATAPLGCEETEFSIRVAQRLTGSVLWYEPKASVDHVVSADRLRIAYFARRCFAEGLSKAVIADLIGSSDATASERTYVTRTLRHAAGRELAAAARGNVGGLGRAVAIAGGLGLTALGYALGRVGLGAQALRLIDPARRSVATSPVAS
ncbi:glycosyltransferase [Acidiferrimicrobium sp. IK]|uniref:glycosyltransferase family 2 protein n=1 Tax=Acidiferrimicrobium sp. IK TaxID=2871700 RepID=UPI0021CB4370|nr:glycosyltransferase family 2 protein [Acidiferrimicrobium sp. IK]MCU4186176.1 glycosyltransferase [Acidiferrimicrobium sp. IK]